MENEALLNLFTDTVTFEKFSEKLKNRITKKLVALSKAQEKEDQSEYNELADEIADVVALGMVEVQQTEEKAKAGEPKKPRLWEFSKNRTEKKE
jgi:hypothetical protein